MAFAPALLAPPDEQTQDAALVANVVDPVALGASQVLPPPPLPAPAANLPVDALMSAASEPLPAVPPTPVDAALAPALPPQGGPALSVLPPPVPVAAPTTPVEAAKGNVDKLAALDVEQQKIADEKTRLETEQATAKAEHDRQRSIALDKLTQQQEMHRVQAASAVAEARSKAESEPYHTLLESRSIGQNVATGIGLILGGVSWNANHVNRGVQMLEMAMRENEVLQRQRHADLWQAVAAAERGEAALDQRQLRETAAFSARQGAAWDAVAGRLGAMIAANKGKGDTATAKRVMIESSEKAVAAWQNAESAAAAAAHLKELEKEAEEANRIREIRALKYKTKGGGVGGGSSREGDAIKLKEKIIEFQKSGLKGTELAVAVDKAATALKIPLTGKPNTLNARQIMADVGKVEHQQDIELNKADKDETRIIRDPDTGEPIRKAQTAKGASSFATRDVQLGDAAHRMQELADDIKEHGRKVVKPEDVQRRVTKYANAIIAVGIVSPLGKTNESLHLEGRSIGLPGAFDPTHIQESLTSLVTSEGANLDAIVRKVAEMKKNRQSYRNTLPELTPEEKKKYANRGGGEPDKPDLTLKDGGTARWNKERGGYERVADIVL